MAFMAAMLKGTLNSTGSTTTLGLRRCYRAIALPSPIDNLIDHRPSIPSPPLVLPEVDRSFEKSGFDFHFPSFFSFAGSMELMAVPKRKTSPHKRGIRNGPKALKPKSVIIRCRACGRVKLPHFYCCSGIRDNEEDQHHASG